MNPSTHQSASIDDGQGQGASRAPGMVERLQTKRQTPDTLAAAKLITELLEALKKADQFITNGIEMGFIRMPDADTPDSAHHTPGIVRAAIAKARGEA